ncbi:hypothetical protein QA635_08735 [Bradyrhizobium brasilense]|uniref:hypothetical protein n=1 Tax=Bradyrhizobium brasilense TaxID=1419277 RepID=UPI0024B1A02C|nr:hypothetical protein [Bradyrhizobium australafricanum]WFU37236.1 hypothetical protein QA635_08735 [Bradyrhizobium australafricanum]
MSAIAKLLGQKEQLLARLEADLGPNERAEIQALLAKIETALKIARHPGFRRCRRRKTASVVVCLVVHHSRCHQALAADILGSRTRFDLWLAAAHVLVKRYR